MRSRNLTGAEMDAIIKLDTWDKARTYLAKHPDTARRLAEDVLDLVRRFFWTGQLAFAAFALAGIGVIEFPGLVSDYASALVTAACMATFAVAGVHCVRRSFRLFKLTRELERLAKS